MSGKFKRIMNRACDRTKPRKDGVLVTTEDWHALMDLAAARSDAAPAPVQGEAVAYMHRHGAIWRLDNCPAGIDFTEDGWRPLYLAPPPTDAEAVRRAALAIRACRRDKPDGTWAGWDITALNRAIANLDEALSSQPPATEGE